MDKLLQGMMNSVHSDGVKWKFVQQVAKSAACTSHRSADIQAVMEVAARLFLEGTTKLEVESGELIYTEWAKAHPAGLEGYFTRQFLIELLDSQYPNPANVPNLILITFQHMRSGPYLASLQRIMQSKAIKFVTTHYEVECIVALLQLLQTHKEVVPRGDSLVKLCQELLMWVGRLVVSAEIVTMDFLVTVDALAKGIVFLCWNSSETQNASLQTIFEILTQEKSPSLCLGALVTHIPTKSVEAKVAAVVTFNKIDDSQMIRALERMLDWLSWPTAGQVSVWVLSFFNCLAVAKRTNVLLAITESRAVPVLQKLQFVFAKHSCLQILSIMLLSYQHCPRPFHEVLEAIRPVWVTLEEKESPNPVSQGLADLIHTLMYIHSGYPEIYSPILDLIKAYKKPSEAEMRQNQDQTRWEVTDSWNSLQDVSVPSIRASQRVALTNSGVSCYVNTVVQSLLTHDRFRRFLMTGELRGPVADKLREVFAFLMTSERAEIILDDFRRLFLDKFPMNMQEDCQEFMIHLLQKLFDEEKAMRGKQPSSADPADGSSGDGAAAEDSENLTQMEKIFWGKMRHSMDCQDCHHQTSSVTDQTSVGIIFEEGMTSTQRTLPGGREAAKSQPMEVEGVESNETLMASSSPASSMSSGGPLHLQDLVKNCFRPSKPEGETTCENCGKQNRIKYDLFTRAPDTLQLTLYRFAFDRNTASTQKIQSRVIIPRTLLLPVDRAGTMTDPNDPHVELLGRLQGPDNNGTSYEVFGLTCIMLHTGNSPHNGHYFAITRHAVRRPECLQVEGEYDFYEDDWMKFNDTSVAPMTFSSILMYLHSFQNETPYHLLYTRVGTEVLDSRVTYETPFSQLDPPLRPDLMAKVADDNAKYYKELEAATQRRKRKLAEQPTPSYNWKDFDSDQGPPGNCGGGEGFGGFNSGPHFVF